ncbi:MAG: hypothetical protein KAS38_16015 [Anaerolineales bacterium]|nr:hypothetical protein [Anaerolineales bacterium]
MSSAQPNNQRTKLESGRLLLATLLWILAGTISVGVIWANIVNISGLGYYEGGIILGLGFMFGGIFGGIFGMFITRFLLIWWQKKGWVLSLILPILVISPAIFQIILRESFFLLFLGILGILGFSYVVLIPRLIKRLWRKFHGAWWVVVVALALIILNTFCLLILMFGMMGQ